MSGTADTTTDPPQDTVQPHQAKPAVPSVKTYLGKGKTKHRSKDKSMRSRPPDTKVSEGGGEGGAPSAGAEILLQLLEETMVEQTERCKNAGEAERNHCVLTAISPTAPRPDATHCIIEGTEHNLGWYQGRGAGASGVKE